MSTAELCCICLDSPLLCVHAVKVTKLYLRILKQDI